MIRKNKATGTCWGISSIVALNKIHSINFPKTVGASSDDYNLYDLSASNEKVRSMILCYHALLHTKAGQERLQRRYYLNEIENEVSKVKNGGNPVRISVQFQDNDANEPETKWSGHTVVGFDVEKEKAFKGDITYTKKIKIYDCNFPGEVKYIYFNDLGQFYAPSENWSNQNAFFYEASSSLDDLSVHNNTNWFQPTVTMPQNQGITAVSSTNNTRTNVKESWQGYVNPAESGGNAKMNYILPDKNESYSFIPSSNDKSVNISLHYGNAYYSVDTDSADKVETSPDGKLKISGNTGHYNITIADNKKAGNNYHTYKIEGNGKGDVVMNLTSEGVDISGSAVKNAKLTEEGDTKQDKKNINGPTKVAQNDSDQSTVIDTAQSVPMFRLYNPHSGEHFYTGVRGERNHLVKVGWRDEGIGWTAPKSGTPVYRLYNKNGGEHHYTMRASERRNLIKHGWKDEGIGWYSGGSVPLYRQYNPNAFANNHNYTKSTGEKNHLIRLGWRDEGIAWYGVA